VTAAAGGRSLFHSAECALGSILAHAGVAWLAVGMSQGGRQLPTDEREARVFFLLPPDRVDVRPYQSEVFQWGRPGARPQDGSQLSVADEGWRLGPRHGARPAADRSGARPSSPSDPHPFDSRHHIQRARGGRDRGALRGSAAPAYPPTCSPSERREWFRRRTWWTPRAGSIRQQFRCCTATIPASPSPSAPPSA
jgi:hypothetical protein